jgi:hypothetical protein
MIRLREFIDEKFLDIAKVDGKDKGDWVNLSKPKLEPIVKKDLPTRKNLFDLVDFAYKSTLKEPNASIKTADDVLGNKYTYWEAIDIDGNPDADAVIFGKKKYGIKITGIGHNGEKISKSILMKKHIELLKKHGYWCEAASRPAEIFFQSGVNVVTDKEKLQKLFPDAQFLQFFDDGSYIRTGHKSGKYLREYVFGNPII